MPRIKDLFGLNPHLRDQYGDNTEGFFPVLYRATVAYTDTAAKNLFILPAYTIVLMINVIVTTAFNDTGTDQLNLGKTGTATHFKSALDVSAAGQTNTGWSNVGLSIGASDIQVIGTYAGQNANASAGAAAIVFHCAQPV